MVKNILILNMPSSPPVMRRYNCSYRASGFLYPPEELLRAATLIKNNSDMRVFFLDAVAERKGIDHVISFLHNNRINAVITLVGLENVGIEISFIKTIKTAVSIPVAGIGFYVCRFREEFSCLDVALDGAFEVRIKKALAADGDLIDNLKRLEPVKMEHEADIIDYTDRSFLKENLYADIFVKGKTAWMFYAFGCSYRCSYCVKTYDSDRWSPRSYEKVFEEIEMLAGEGYRNIRFLDDNITVDREFLGKLYEFLEKKKIKINFYGFSRADLINRKSAGLLSLLNFKRIYIGIETFSPDSQVFYRKYLDVSKNLNERINYLTEKGVEATAWILYDPEKDPLMRFPVAAWRLSRIKVSLALLNVLVPYRGTPLYEERISGRQQGRFAISMAGPVRGFAAAVLFYGSYGIYFANWPYILYYVTKFPGEFLKYTLGDIFAAAGVFAPSRSNKRAQDY